MAEAARTLRTVTPPAPAPATRRTTGPPARAARTRASGFSLIRPIVRLSEDAAPASRGSLPTIVAQLVDTAGPGDPLPAPTQAALERTLEVPLRPVRVHSDPRTRAVVDGTGTRAFTYGLHVYLGSRERPDDVTLMAHEVAHVIQQQGRPVLQMYSPRPRADVYEQEAHATSAAVQRGERTHVVQRTGEARVQPIWPVDEAEAWLESQGWDLLNRWAPELVPIIRQGPLEWLKEKITSAVESVFDTLMAPVRTVSGIAGELMAHFNDLLAWMREAAARLSRGDCGALSEASDKIQKVIEGLAAPVIDKLKQVASKVGDFFSGLWDRFGAPAWDFLKRVGGQAWEKVQRLGQWIWEKTAPIRSTLARAWTWVKNKLGIGEGPEGQDGILQWVQRKASAAWDEHIKPFLEKYKRPLLVVGGILVMLSPAGPVIAIGAVVGGLMVGIHWVQEHMRTPDGVVQNRGVLRDRIIPAIMGAVNGVTTFLTRTANTIADKLTGVLTGLNGAIGAVAGSVFRFAVSVIQWLADRFKDFVQWAMEKLVGLADWVSQGLERLRVFLQPLFDFLGELIGIIGNLMQIPLMLAGRLWNMIPACIRNKVVDFLVTQVLMRIPMFAEIFETPEVFSQMAAELVAIIRMVFRDRDLIGAMKRAFQLLLRVLHVPVDLAITVIQKAARAWDAVFAKPVQFLKNVVGAIKQGFLGFFRNIRSHLAYGLEAWLLGPLADLGIRPPASWTDLREIFRFVLDVLGITKDHIFELLGRRLDPVTVRRLRTAWNLLTGAWEWIVTAMRDGPKALAARLMDRIRDFGSMLFQAVTGWIITTIITQASIRLSALAASGGLSGVIEGLVAFYRGVQTVIRWAKKILEIANSVLDMILNIAAGVLGPAAQLLESALRRALPIAISFLAGYIGLGGVAGTIRGFIEDLRLRVDEGILWLIDQALRVGRGILNALGLGQAQAGQPSGQPGEHNLDRNVDLGGETHIIRAHRGADGIQLLLASRPFSQFTGRLNQIEAEYVAHFQQNGMSALAGQLEEDIRPIRAEADKAQSDATRVGPTKAMNEGEYMRASGEADRILDAAVPRLVAMLTALGPKYAFGPGKAAKQNDPVILKRTNPVSAYVDQVGLVTGGGFGLTVRYEIGTTRESMLYKDYGQTWELATPGSPLARPALVPYSGSRPVRQSIIGLPLNPNPTNPSGSVPGLGAPFTHRGHCIANRFFGPNSGPNIVAMTETTNLSRMKSIENTVANDIRDYGHVFRYEVTPTPDIDPPPNLQVVATRIWPGPPSVKVSTTVPNTP